MSSIRVIVPTYNHGRYITQCIESILPQEVSIPFEIVVLDDCSTDETTEILREFEKNYPDKIHVLVPEKNRNDNRALREAIDQSKSDYIAFLEGDDYWTSLDKLQKQVDYLNTHPDFSLCFHKMMKFYQDGNHAPEEDPGDYKEVSRLEDLFPCNRIKLGSVMARRSAIKGIPDWFISVLCADWTIYIHAAQHGKIGFIPEVLGAYRVHSAGVWSGKTEIQQLEELVKYYKVLIANLDPKYSHTLKGILTREYYELSLAYANVGNLERARSNLSRCILSLHYNEVSFKDLYKTWIRLHSGRVASVF